MEADLPLDALDLPGDEVRARFRRARRSGNALWLWPEVEPAAWRAALQAVEAAARGVLAGCGTPRIDCDPEALGLAAYTSGMGPLLGHWVERGAVEADGPCGALLRLHLRHNRLRMARLAAEGAAVVERLAAAGVPATVLKGMHTASAYFAEPGARPLSDIDLLVPPDRLAAAEGALAGAGYRRGTVLVRPYRGTWTLPEAPSLPRSLRLVHADDPWSVDLQLSLDRTFSPAAVARLDALQRREAPPWGPHPGARVLAQPLLTIFLAAHASESLRSLTLLRLVELALVVRRDREAGALEWAELRQAAGNAGALGCLYPALELCERLAEGTVPPDLLAAASAAAPPAVRRTLAGLTPATAQRMHPGPLRERYMWSPTWRARLRQLAHELRPTGYPASALAGIYRARAWRVFRAVTGG